MNDQGKNSPNRARRIVYAGTRDAYFFRELWTDEVRDRAGELGFNVEIPDFTAPVPLPLWLDFLAGADGIITSWGAPKIDRLLLERAPALKIVGHAAGSVAQIVSPELFAAGVKVTGANEIMSFSVAEWCLMAALMGRRQVTDYLGFGAFSSPRFGNQPRSSARSIRYATVGIWGFGAVAANLVGFLKPLEPARILVNSGHLGADEALRYGVEAVGFDTLIERSDIVFTLAGLNPRTTGTFSREVLARLKDGCLVINAGRGALFDEDALAAELRTGRLSAVLDVFCTEPLPEESCLRKLPNAILSPHTAGYPNRDHYVTTCLEEFDRFFRGEPLRYEINPEKVPFMTGSTTAKV